MSIDYNIIGKRIKEKRKFKSMTQETLAEHLDVSVGYISQLERGITHINLDTLSNISIALGCDITEFLTDVTISGETFLSSEIINVFNTLNDRHRKMLLEIAEILKRHQT